MWVEAQTITTTKAQRREEITKNETVRPSAEAYFPLCLRVFVVATFRT